MIPNIQQCLDDIYLTVAALEDVTGLLLNEDKTTPGGQCLWVLNKKLVQDLDKLHSWLIQKKAQE